MAQDLSFVKTVGKGSFWIFWSNIIVKFVGIGTIFIFLKKLSVYEYGLAELALSVVPFLSIFMLPGISSQVIADMGAERGKGDKSAMKSIFRDYFSLQFILAVIAWAIVFFGSNIIAKYYHGDISSLLKIISFSFLISVIRVMYTTTFSVYLNFFVQSVHTLVEESSKLIFAFIFIMLVGWGSQGLVLSGVLAQISALIILAIPFFHLTRDFLYVKADRPLSILNVLKDHGKWSLFSSYLSNFGETMRIWIIRFFLGTSAVGLYAVASGLFSNTASLVPLSKVLGPLIPQYVSDRSRFNSIVNKSAKYQGLAFLLLSIVALLVFPPVLGWLFPKYIPSLPLFRVMILALLGTSFATLFTTVFFALKEQKSFFFSMVAKTLSTVIILPILLYSIGIFGIGLEFVFTVYLVAIERYVAVRKLRPDLKIFSKSFFSYNQDDKMLLDRIIKFVKSKTSRLFA